MKTDPRRPARLAAADPDALATDVLHFLAADDERLARFFALTGLDPASLRATAKGPGFARAVLSYLSTDDALLVAFAEHAGLTPEAVGTAVRALTEEPSFD